MAASKPLDQQIEFIALAVRGETGISLPALRDIYKDHDGLSDETAAGHILKVIELGYIAATPAITDKGREFLKAR